MLTPLKQSNEFRPDVADIEKFLQDGPDAEGDLPQLAAQPDRRRRRPKQTCSDIADLVRGKNIAVFSDEPYCHMVWKGRHHSLLRQPGMMEQCVAAYTFSKSYSMSGWRLGFAVAVAEIADAIGKMINTTLSCTPPIVQLAGTAALKRDQKERDEADAEVPREGRAADRRA